jgi:DNA-binding beta-propeller fold protein YncE
MASRWLRTVQAIVLTCTSALVATAAAEPARAAVPVRLYVMSPDTDVLTVLDPAAADPVVAHVHLSGLPQGVVLNAAGTRAYLPLAGGWVAEVDTRVHKVVKWIAVPSAGLYSAAVSPDGLAAYVVHQVDTWENRLLRASMTDGAITGSWPLDGTRWCQHVRSQGVGSRIFVSCNDLDISYLFNLNPGVGTLVRSDSMDQVVDLAVSRDGTRVYALDRATWRTYTYDPVSTAELGWFAQGEPVDWAHEPRSIAAGAVTGEVYQALAGSPGTIRRWNAGTGQFQDVASADPASEYSDVEFFDGRAYAVDPGLGRVVATGHPERAMPVPGGVSADHDSLAAGPAPAPLPPGNTKLALAAAAGGYTLTATNVDATNPARLRLTMLLSGVPARVVTARPSEGRCVLAGDRFSCEVARIPPGGTVRVAVEIRTGGIGRLTATAEVIGEGLDRYPADNRAVLTTAVR